MTQPGQPDPPHGPAPQPAAPPPQSRPEPVLEGEILPPLRDQAAAQGPPAGQPYREAAAPPPTSVPRQPTGAPPTGPPPGWAPPTGASPAGAPPAGQPLAEEPFRDNLGVAVAMFLLFPPFALPATIDARRARIAYRAGQLGVAQDNAKESRRWTRAGFVAGPICWGLVVCCGVGSWLLRSIGVPI